MVASLDATALAYVILLTAISSAAVTALAVLLVTSIISNRSTEGRDRKQHFKKWLKLHKGTPTRSLPRKIILIRHAQSQGNVDAAEYAKTPDSEVPLVR